MSGSINLVGPSTVPAAPQITPGALDAAVNAALITNANTAATATAAEATRAKAAEAVNTAALGPVTANTTAIAAEVTNRTAADTAEVTARNAAIQVETARAQAAEGVNASNILIAQSTAASATSTETTRALAAEGVHTTNIATNTTAISTEATARAAAITAEVTARNAAVQVETARATGAEATLAANDVVASTTLPIMATGLGVIGVATTFAHGDHAHPVDTSRYAANNPSAFQTSTDLANALVLKAPVANPVFTGLLTTTNASVAGTLSVAGITTMQAATVDGSFLTTGIASSIGSEVQIVARNPGANVGMAGVGFTTANETANPKAGIGLVRQNANGVGRLGIFNSNNAATTAAFTTTDERLSIFQDGRVGIGSTANDNVNQLQVAGSIAEGGTSLASKYARIEATAIVTALAGAPLALTVAINIVTVSPAGGGVKLPSLAHVVVVNRGANNVTVSPPTGGTIEGQATQFILPGGSATFVSADLTAFYAI